MGTRQGVEGDGADAHTEHPPGMGEAPVPLQSSSCSVLGALVLLGKGPGGGGGCSLCPVPRGGRAEGLQARTGGTPLPLGTLRGASWRPLGGTQSAPTATEQPHAAPWGPLLVHPSSARPHPKITPRGFSNWQSDAGGWDAVRDVPWEGDTLGCSPPPGDALPVPSPLTSRAPRSGKLRHGAGLGGCTAEAGGGADPALGGEVHANAPPSPNWEQKYGSQACVLLTGRSVRP